MVSLKSRIKKYQKILLAILEEQKRDFPKEKEMEEQVVADTVRNHFQLVRTGWIGDDRFNDIIMQFEIKPDGKIWIQSNWTEVQLDVELIKKGVLTSNIVLGMQPPAYRQFSDYAIA